MAGTFAQNLSVESVKDLILAPYCIQLRQLPVLVKCYPVGHLSMTGTTCNKLHKSPVLLHNSTIAKQGGTELNGSA